MRDCDDFLRWCLPRLGLRWPGYRNVRGQVCKRIARRVAELGLVDLQAYQTQLSERPDEWQLLDGLCRVTISRFHRDAQVFAGIEEEVLPAVARLAVAAGDAELRCWSAGCASGEEPYTLQIIWSLRVQKSFPGLRLRVVATDADAALLERAAAGVYPPSSLKELPDTLVKAAFEPFDDRLRLRDPLRNGIELRQQNLRTTEPPETFHIVLCRNVAFTYFDEDLRRACLERIARRLIPGGALVIGAHEQLPPSSALMTPWSDRSGSIFRRT